MSDFRGCLICLQDCASKRCEIVSDTKFKDSQLFNEGLNVMFVLKSVLGLPKELIEKCLIKHGSPMDWGIFVCAECQQKYMDRATSLQFEESRIQQQFEMLRKDVKGHIHTSHLADQLVGPPVKGQGRGKRKVGPNKPGPVFNEVRKWVVDNGGSGTKGGIEQAIELAGGINNYMEHIKAEKAFLNLGPGRKLTDYSSSQPGPSSSITGISISKKGEISVSSECVPSGSGNQSTTVASSGSVSIVDESSHNSNPPRSNLNNPDPGEVDAANIASEQKRAAAAAALARFEKARKPNADSKELLASRQSAFIKEQVRKELEQEKTSEGSNSLPNGPESSNSDVGHNSMLEIPKRVIDPANYAVQGVFYRCPQIGLSTPLPKLEVEKQIREYLTNQINDVETPYHIPIQIIYSCNKPLEKVTMCIDLLWKYIDNIIQNPTDHKYRQIKCSNRAFKERVASVFGGELLLRTAAFRKDMIPNMDTWNQEEEEYWVFDPEDDVTFGPELIKLRNMLKSTAPIKPVLDRNVQVLRPQQITSRSELPDEFYVLSRDEIQRQQQSKTEIAERELTLRTKAMRERDEISERRIYRFGVIRVKFPDSNILQGTFNASDKLSDLFKFVENSLISDFEFDLIQPGGSEILSKSKNQDATLSELNLLPSTILNFRAGTDTPASILAGDLPYLNTTLMEKIVD